MDFSFLNNFGKFNLFSKPKLGKVGFNNSPNEEINKKESKGKMNFLNILFRKNKNIRKEEKSKNCSAVRLIDEKKDNKETNKNVYSQEINKKIGKKPKGIMNLGLSCYMNSLLQCLYYIKELREFFINNKDKFNEEQKVCKAFAEVMNGLKNNEKDFFKPKEFKSLIGEKNNLFYGKKAGDVKDLLFNLIDLFLSELNNENDNDDLNDYDNIYYDKKRLFKEMQKEIDKNNIINKLFIGYYETQYDCLEKKISIYSFQIESFILFELEKIEKYHKTNILSIELCFDYYYREQKNSSFYCYKCEKVHKGNAHEKIYRPPKILIIILDRGHGKTFKGEVDIHKYIGLKYYIDEENSDYCYSYELIGVSTHEGESSSRGHYTARCLTDQKKYYYFSDYFVKEINEDDLFTDEPYLLFYQQIDINEYNNESDINGKDNNKIIKKEEEIIINNINQEKTEGIEITDNNKTKEIIKKNDKSNIIDNINILKDNSESLGNEIPNNNLAIKRNVNNKSNRHNIEINRNKVKENIKSRKIKKNIRIINSNNINYKNVWNNYQIFFQKSNVKYKIYFFYNNVEILKFVVNAQKVSIYENRKYSLKFDYSKDFNKLSDNINNQITFYILKFRKEIDDLANVNYKDKNIYEELKNLFKLFYFLFKQSNSILANSNYGKLKTIKNC